MKYILISIIVKRNGVIENSFYFKEKLLFVN